MIDILNLALPYFGLIFLGYACGRLQDIPDRGLAWMDFFILYMALPALFYRILATTPFEQLNNVPFIVATTLATFLVLALSFAIALAIRRDLAQSAIAALAGGYGNIGYMGPGLALATLGAQAAAPVALIFCFESLLFFSLLPFAMAIARPDSKGFGGAAIEVARKILLNPLVIATALGVLSAAVKFEPPVALDRLMQFLQSASAPCALFTLGVTVALRLRPRAVGGAGSGGDQAHRAPGGGAAAVDRARSVRPALGRDRRADGGAAAGAERVRAGAAIRGLGRAGVGIGPARTLLSVATLTTVMWLVQQGSLPQSLLP